jgi:hypothetical protein
MIALFPTRSCYTTYTISNTGFADLPLRLPNRNGWDYFQRLSSEDVPDEIKTRFSH